ncbi:MAG: TIR domain-containing protein [Terriglobales bacterium]
MSLPYQLRSLQALNTRRKAFISYFHGDLDWAQHFVSTFGAPNGVFIPKALGLDYDGADRINSQNTDYVMDQIRAKCIDDSSVQIVLIGPCTHSRRYIDWEIKRALLAGNGLLGIHLPTAATVNLPERFAANWSADGSGYARFWAYPNNAVDLRNWIDDAYQARTSRQTLRKNTNEVWGYNQRCKVCGITH